MFVTRFTEEFGIEHLASGARGRTEVLEKGDVEGGMWWAGQAQGLIDGVASCAEVVDQIMRDAYELIDKRLPALIAAR